MKIICKKNFDLCYGEYNTCAAYKGSNISLCGGDKREALKKEWREDWRKSGPSCGVCIDILERIDSLFVRLY